VEDLQTTSIPDPARAGVSVVIPCLNEAPHIERVLSELAGQDAPLEEVILVDGGSTDGTLHVVERFRDAHPGFPLKVLPAAGQAIPQALNAGIRSASGAVIVRVDAHCRPLPGYLARSVAALRIPRAGVVGGAWQITPGARGRLARAIAFAVSDPFGAGDARYRIGAVRADVVDVDTVPFGCFTKRLWATLGGYDERLKTNEDYDFNYRVRQAGFRVILDPEIRSEYFARPDLGKLARQYFRYGWWKADMLRLHPRSLRWRQAVPVLFASALLATACAGILAPSTAWVFASLVALYLAAAFLASLRICAKRRAWDLLFLLPFVFGTVHLSWGFGLIANLPSARSGAAAAASPAARPSANPRP